MSWFGRKRDSNGKGRPAKVTRERRKHGDPRDGTGCGQMVPIYPGGRFYKHSPCDTDTVGFERLRPDSDS